MWRIDDERRTISFRKNMIRQEIRCHSRTVFLFQVLFFLCNSFLGSGFQINSLQSTHLHSRRVATTAYMSPPVGKSGARMILTDQSFYDISSNQNLSDLPVLIFFSAPWCGPCRLSNPVVRDIGKEFAGQIDVLEISTDDLPDCASDAGVVSIPTIQIYHGGKCLDTIVGCVAKNVLASAVSKVLEDIGPKVKE